MYTMFQYDDSDPQMVIVNTGPHHGEPEDFRDLVNRWIERLDQGQRFGILMISEPHDHDEDEHDSEEHLQDEAEIQRILNDFRRDYRHRTALINTAYARVHDQEVIDKYYPTPELVEQAQIRTNMYAEYNWGIPGRGFTDVEEAKAWLRSQQNRAPLELKDATPDLTANPTGRVGLFYGSSSGVTEYVAGLIADAWTQHAAEPLESFNIGYVKDAAQLLAFDTLILGISTWNIGQLQDDWDIIFPQLDGIDFMGKRVALFGPGDQNYYPDNFVDAMGILAEKLMERGAVIVGQCDCDGYEFAASRALINGQFIGLPLDEVTQADLTGERVQRWVAQIVQEFALQAAATA